MESCSAIQSSSDESGRLNRARKFLTLECLPGLILPIVQRNDSKTLHSGAHATRACFDHHGPVRQCLGLGQAQSQSAHCATSSEKASQSAGFHSINKGNCEPVPLIGQFWTVVTSAQLPVTV